MYEEVNDLRQRYRTLFMNQHRILIGHFLDMQTRVEKLQKDLKEMEFMIENIDKIDVSGFRYGDLKK